MKLTVFENYHDLSARVAEEIISLVSDKPKALFTIATGDTPKGAYDHLAKLAHERNVDFSKAYFAALDEWVGVPRDNPGSCYSFLNAHLFDRVPFSKKNISLFDVSGDLNEECERMDRFISKNGPIELMVVGVGINGHVGFNEPALPPHTFSFIAELAESTKKVGQKYFPSAVNLKQGLSLGFKHFFQAKKVIVIANGSHKADIVFSALNAVDSAGIPVTLLRRHKNAYLWVDRPAAEKLQKTSSQ